jgi:hypothetical protein
MHKKVVITLHMYYSHKATRRSQKMQYQKLLMPHWHAISRCGSEPFVLVFVPKGSYYNINGSLQQDVIRITQDAKPNVVDTPLTLNRRMGK